MSKQRLDELTATLARTQPVLDDATRARVGAAIAARLGVEAAPARRPPSLVLAGEPPAPPASEVIALSSSSAPPITGVCGQAHPPARPLRDTPAPGTHATVGRAPRNVRRNVLLVGGALAAAVVAVMIWQGSNIAAERDRADMPELHTQAVVQELASAAAERAAAAAERAAAAAAATESRKRLDIKMEALAQMAVTEVRTALDANDPASRRMAASLLADLPRPYALALLPTALTDRHAQVRIAAAISAGRMNTESAAAPLVAALQSEVDPSVSAHQIQALGELGPLAGTVAHETLRRMAARPGRLAVLAVGALIATGDLSDVRTLAAEMAAPQAGRRLVAVQAAAMAANQPVVRPVLRTALDDRMLQIRLTAAEALARVGDTTAHPVLRSAAKSSNRDIAWRAEAVLARLGSFTRDPRGAAEMLRKIIVDTHAPKRRIAVVPLLRAYGSNAGAPVLQSLLADADRNVRLAAIDAIEDVAAGDVPEAVRLYRPLVTDDDGFVRAKAAGLLARLQASRLAIRSRPTSPPPPTAVPGTANDPASQPRDAAAAHGPGLDPQFLARSADLEYVRATLERDPATRRAQLLRVQDAYRQIAAGGVDDLVRHATARLAEIDAALAEH